MHVRVRQRLPVCVAETCVDRLQHQRAPVRERRRGGSPSERRRIPFHARASVSAAESPPGAREDASSNARATSCATRRSARPRGGARRDRRKARGGVPRASQTARSWNARAGRTRDDAIDRVGREELRQRLRLLQAALRQRRIGGLSRRLAVTDEQEPLRHASAASRRRSRRRSTAPAPSTSAACAAAAPPRTTTPGTSRARSAGRC